MSVAVGKVVKGNRSLEIERTAGDCFDFVILHRLTSCVDPNACCTDWKLPGLDLWCRQRQTADAWHNLGSRSPSTSCGMCCVCRVTHGRNLWVPSGYPRSISIFYVLELKGSVSSPPPLEKHAIFVWKSAAGEVERELTPLAKHAPYSFGERLKTLVQLIGIFCKLLRNSIKVREEVCLSVYC